MVLIKLFTQMSASWMLLHSFILSKNCHYYLDHTHLCYFKSTLGAFSNVEMDPCYCALPPTPGRRSHSLPSERKRKWPLMAVNKAA